MKFYTINLVITTFFTLNCDAKIMRNNALISKMVTNFQKDNLSTEPERERKQKPEKVMSLMQNVLCRNFPTIPCEIITKDKTLNKLIERSIQQINYKKIAIDRTTQAPGLTLFPSMNSEDISNFLQVRESKVFSKQKKKHKKSKTVKNIEKKPQEYTKKIKRKESKRTSVYSGRKKLRKFYPHKVKYKDKNRNTKDFGDYSEDKMSISVENPDIEGKRQHYSYKLDPENSVWRIDYTKHGEPSLNVVAYDERLTAKTGSNVIVDKQTARKDVLHPDVYIKKNYVKQNIMDLHSDGID